MLEVPGCGGRSLLGQRFVQCSLNVFRIFIYYVTPHWDQMPVIFILRTVTRASNEADIARLGNLLGSHN